MILRGTGVESRALTLSYIPGSLCKFLFWDSASLSYWTVQTGLEFAWASRGWDYRQTPLYPANILNSIQCVLAFKSPLGDNTRVQASDLNGNCLPPPRSPSHELCTFIPIKQGQEWSLAVKAAWIKQVKACKALRLAPRKNSVKMRRCCILVKLFHFDTETSTTKEVSERDLGLAINKALKTWASRVQGGDLHHYFPPLPTISWHCVVQIFPEKTSSYRLCSVVKPFPHEFHLLCPPVAVSGDLQSVLVAWISMMHHKLCLLPNMAAAKWNPSAGLQLTGVKLIGY